MYCVQQSVITVVKRNLTYNNTLIAGFTLLIYIFKQML